MSYDFIPHSKSFRTASNLDPSLLSDNISKRIGGSCLNKQCKNPCGFVTRADIVLFGLVFVIIYLIIIFINPISLRKAGSDEIDKVTAVILALFIAFIALALYSLKQH